jgi:hypothetical protein
VHDEIETNRSELAANKMLSDIGRGQKLQELAKSEAQHVAKARRALVAAQDRMRDQRKALAPTVRDKSDVAAASLRQEIRGAMKSMPRGEIASLVNDPKTDSIVLEAFVRSRAICRAITRKASWHTRSTATVPASSRN